ncbi:proline--tRNA ligase [Paenibacillus dokdonensis]|uniref:Proline--tRNA ligase n=1 Tax=Paenibacillus dokdonensis TaxID=2567944 RepID=A0ABU6GRB8_9BACL|nr:proline--tRNA ligase [Paenibacillus dokdonensis]MEC0242253.1 proline--tRNA ligase [Paenibacillus dokdonensis]
MRQKNMLLPTLREAPSEAEAVSHQLLLRGGYIRQLAAGIYSYLPLGYRVLHKLEQIIRQEMSTAGFDELLMPAMQPSELWEQSGRYTEYGPELIRLEDRHDRGFVLGPTHEEIITSLVAAEVNAYRKLPLRLYQIQTKFRDERRPRFGLLRGREFLMKDAYSFDTDWQGLDEAYQSMVQAYRRIFERCGLRFKAVEAEAGSIGGEGETLEFMALADIGEDTIVTCSACDYAANLEKATFYQQEISASMDVKVPDMEEIYTPDTRTIEELSVFLNEKSQAFLKTMVYMADDQPIAVVVRGDHEVNEFKLKNALGASNVELADLQTVEKLTGAPHGFAGPAGLDIPVYLDLGAASVVDGIAGANRKDYHVRHINAGRDFQALKTGDYRNATADDCCPHCGQKLLFSRGIEVGHVFKLGTKYSKSLDAKFTNADGREELMIMGCYGIGVSRLMSAVAEQYQSETGILWPLQLSPFQVHIIPVSMKDEVQSGLANELYRELKLAGIDVILDDRDERPGVKFKDADLIGASLRIIVGKAAAEGQVEWLNRLNGSEKEQLGVEKVLELIHAICSASEAGL